MRAPRRAFTLLEAIVAVAIGTAFLASLAVFVTNLGDARARLGALSARIDATDAVFTLCEQALATAVVGQAGDSGVRGDAMRLRVRSATVGLDERDGGVLGGMRTAEISFDAAAGRLAIRRGSRESRLEVPVRAFRVRYLDEDGWLEEYDSAASGRFPVAIEVAIWFARGDADASERSGRGVVEGERGDGDASDDAERGAEEDAVSTPALDAFPTIDPDRRRLFRIAGAPRVDPLAARGIREETGP
jgi:hypothetical protein